MRTKYTPEELELSILALRAFHNGKPIEQKSDGEDTWVTIGRGGFVFDFNGGWLYRPKPEPKTRPWSKPDDVPGPVCWIRGKGDYRMAMIVGFSGEVSYQTVTGGCQPVMHSGQFYDTRWAEMEYSTDRKTWHKCEVTEA